MFKIKISYTKKLLERKWYIFLSDMFINITFIDNITDNIYV